MQSLNEPTAVVQVISEPPTFANDSGNIDFKLKDYSTSYDDVTVRMVSKQNSNAGCLSTPLMPEVEQKSNDLYTDPKLLDLIKKDLEEIQQKSRITSSGLMKDSSIPSFKMVNAINLHEHKEL